MNTQEGLSCGRSRHHFWPNSSGAIAVCNRSDADEHGPGYQWWASRGAVAAGWAVAGWPVWRWYATRVADGSDEPFGPLALLTALVFVPWGRIREPLPCGSAVVATVAIAASFFGYSVLPDLVRAGLWMLALVAILGPAGPWVPRAGLLLLSLPVVATAEFYLGYPLRAAMAVGSVPVLRLLGYEVIRQGAALRWAGETVLVDAPCSGIQMLWTGLFAACTLAAAMRIGGLATAGLLCCTAGVVAIANLLRCALLFVYEVKAGMPPAWIHEGVGLALFAGALGIVLWLVRRTRGSDPGKPDRGRGPGHSSLAADWVVPLLGVLLLAAAVRPLFGRNLDSATDSAFPGWPAEFEGRQLSLLLPNTREARFAAGFPGKVAGFTDGDRKILMRWVGRETRKLHPAAHCLRGLGYEVQPGPVWRDSTCRQWGTAIATREGRLLKVRERIVDTAGGEWTDVSAWWWAAWRGDSAGPWWAVTVFEGDDS